MGKEVRNEISLDCPHTTVYKKKKRTEEKK